MPTVPLHPRPLHAQPPTENPLPQLLHTPSGLAILELQGTFHFPPSSDPSGSTQLGKLVFPLYDPALNGTDDTKWMKRVYLYVGKGQRMTGECKKLGKPLALVRKRHNTTDGDVVMGDRDSNSEEHGEEELEIAEVVRWKIVFSSRPEPVGAAAGDETG